MEEKGLEKSPSNIIRKDQSHNIIVSSSDHGFSDEAYFFWVD